MRRLRKALNFLNWEQGKGKSKFIQKKIEIDMINDVRYLFIVLNKVKYLLLSLPSLLLP